MAQLETDAGVHATPVGTARAAYLHDRNTLRAAKPKTEADATKVVGRLPDHIGRGRDLTMVQWLYKDKLESFASSRSRSGTARSPA